MLSLKLSLVAVAPLCSVRFRSLVPARKLETSSEQPVRKRTRSGGSVRNVPEPALPTNEAVPAAIRELIRASAACSFWEETHIDALHDKGLVINGLVFSSRALLLLPHYVLSVPAVNRVSDVSRDALCFLELLRPMPGTLILGCDEANAPAARNLLPADSMEYLEKHLGVSFESTTVARACATFNFLNEERRTPAALVILGSKPSASVK